jgi:CBS domain-containing protein
MTGCPHCGHENLPGADQCAGCGQDLSNLDLPRPETPLQRWIMEEPIGNLDLPAPLTVTADASVADAVRVLKAGGHGSVLVLEDGKLVGILTERDLLLRVAGRGSDVTALPVREVMTPDPMTVREQDPVALALNRLNVDGYRHLPVVKDGRPVAFVSVRNLLKHLSEHAV